MGSTCWIAIAAETDTQWRSLAHVVGYPEWSEDGHPWASIVGRLSARTEIDERISAWVATRDRFDVADELQAAGVIAAPVVEPSAMLPSPQLQARGWFYPVDQSYLGTRLLPGFLWHMEPDQPEYERPSALVGEHNREVLAELGYSEAEITVLYHTHAIGEQYSAATDSLLMAD